MTILHLLYSERLSGAEGVVCHIIQTMGSSYRMLYASPEGPIAEVLAERGFAYAPLKELSVSEVRRVVREHGVEMIHAHDMRACFVARAAAPRLPLIFHIHNNATASHQLSVKSVLFRLAARRARHIFWVSESAMRDYRYAAAVRPKSSVLENIVDPTHLAERASQTGCEAYDVIFLGRLKAVKDPLRFVALMRRVADAYPHLRCAMIGTGDMEEQVRARVSALSLDAHIDLLGFCQNPYPQLSRARLMVMTSVYEGMPMAALEALTLGVPIVATPVDGLVSLMGDGRGGVLSDDDATLAQAILHLLRCPDAWQTRHAEAQQIAQAHNDLAAYRARIEAVYEAAAPKKTKGDA